MTKLIFLDSLLQEDYITLWVYRSLRNAQVMNTGRTADLEQSRKRKYCSKRMTTNPDDIASLDQSGKDKKIKEVAR